jgi:hypothetical protein
VITALARSSPSWHRRSRRHSPLPSMMYPLRRLRSLPASEIFLVRRRDLGATAGELHGRFALDIRFSQGCKTLAVLLDVLEVLFNLLFVSRDVLLVGFDVLLVRNASCTSCPMRCQGSTQECGPKPGFGPRQSTHSSQLLMPPSFNPGLEREWRGTTALSSPRCGLVTKYCVSLANPTSTAERSCLVIR